MRLLPLLLLFASCNRDALDGADAAVDRAPALNFDFAAPADDAGDLADLAAPPDLAPPPLHFAPPVSALAAIGPLAVGAADCDQDGRVDFVVGGDGGTVAGLNQGKLKFTAAPVDGLPVSNLYLYDYDRDGSPDLFTVLAKSRFLEVYFARQQHWVGYTTWNNAVLGLAFGAVDADPPGDIAYLGTVQMAPEVWTLVWHDQNQPFSTAGVTELSGDPRAVAIGDADGDGAGDILIADDQAGALLFLHNQGGGKLPLSGTSFPASAALSAIAAADFDGDGRLDAALLDPEVKRIALLRGDGAGGFAKQLFTPVGDGASALAAGDLDGDGVTDLVVACAGSHRVDVLRGTAGGLVASTSVPAGTSPVGVAIGDFDGDGRPDLVVADHGADAALLLINAP